MVRGSKYPAQNCRGDRIRPELRPDITTLENGAIQALLFRLAKCLAVSITAL
jgi:hypothetical protein